MAFYENTIIARQDLSEGDLKAVREKYNEIINSSSGKVIKIEDWGLLNLSVKIKNFKKGFYIHYKFEGNNAEYIFNLKNSLISYLEESSIKYIDLDKEFTKSNSD